MTTHTPTPWRLNSGDSCCINPEALDDPYLIATMGDLFNGDRERKLADAAFIVRAVNNHLALIAALATINNLSINMMESRGFPQSLREKILAVQDCVEATLARVME